MGAGEATRQARQRARRDASLELLADFALRGEGPTELDLAFMLELSNVLFGTLALLHAADALLCGSLPLFLVDDHLLVARADVAQVAEPGDLHNRQSCSNVVRRDGLLEQIHGLREEG